MKNLLIAAVAAFVLGSVSPVQAVAVGGVVRNPGPVQPAFGTFNARVKYIDPHWGSDGRYLTFTYLDVTGSRMEYCENQLSAIYAGGNVVVITYCHQVS